MLGVLLEGLDYTCLSEELPVPNTLLVSLASSPSTPFDQSPPSYAEIASIIKKARAGSSACPLDQISVITLKNVQFFVQFCIISSQIVCNLNILRNHGG